MEKVPYSGVKSGRAFGEDPKPYILASCVLLILEFIRRAFFDYVPTDFTAYISAGDAFFKGLNPFTEARELVPRYAGYPYNYLPGSLYALQALSYFSTATLVAIDWVLRCICLIGVVYVFHRKMFPTLNLGFIILVMIFFQPLNVDLLFGNIITYLFSAFVFSYAIAMREKRKPADYLWIFLFGVIISLKPFWAIPVGYLVLSFGRIKLLSAFIAGFLVLPALTVPLWHWVPSWITHTSAMRKFYISVDLLTLSPPLLVIIWVCGLALGVYFLLRQKQTEGENWIWLLGCVSIPMWPRLGTYSYVICLPLVFFFCERWGWKKGLTFTFVFGPIAWILRDSLTLLPDAQEEQWAFFIWVFIAAFFLVRELKVSAVRKAH